MASREVHTAFVKGVSMNPLLRTGDEVQLEPVSREMLQCGDVVQFTTLDGRKIIHRVIRLEPLQTRGDNCGHDDPPVPMDSPLNRAIMYRSATGFWKPLSGGEAGLRDFRAHQSRRGRLTTLFRMLVPLVHANPFRIPARWLKKSVFNGRCVYYWGAHPVGYTDDHGWHGMGLLRVFVRPPQSQEES